jgi:hypothetical protein
MWVGEQLFIMLAGVDMEEGWVKRQLLTPKNHLNALM